MEPEDKVDSQLHEELERLRRQVVELKARDSARQQVEEELRQAEERYRKLIQGSGDALYTLALDGTLTFLNPAFETATGWSSAEWLGKPFALILHPDDLPLALETFQRVLQGETPPLVELRVLSRAGEYVLGEFVATPDFQEGKVVGAWGLARNISTERTLERQRAELLAMLAHDIKNPLGNILGYTDLLLERVRKRRGTDNEEENLLLRLQSNVLTMHSLVVNYLELSRIEAEQLALIKQPLVLNDLLRRVGQQYEVESQQRRITIEFQLQEELPTIEGDSLALERVFANLLHNALKFTPELGRITVSSATQKEQTVVVAVKDTGPGIAPEEAATIFEKYRRVKSVPPQAGLGLGLFIVKVLVEAHGGQVAVSSTPGQGTCFAVFLPGSGS